MYIFDILSMPNSLTKPMKEVADRVSEAQFEITSFVASWKLSSFRREHSGTLDGAENCTKKNSQKNMDMWSYISKG